MKFRFVFDWPIDSTMIQHINNTYKESLNKLKWNYDFYIFQLNFLKIHGMQFLCTPVLCNLVDGTINLNKDFPKNNKVVSLWEQNMIFRKIFAFVLLWLAMHSIFDMSSCLPFWPKTFVIEKILGGVVKW